MSEATPSPVKQVREFERDQALAAKLQQEFDDEAHAVRMEEVAQIEDEFDAATRRADDERARNAARVREC